MKRESLHRAPNSLELIGSFGKSSSSGSTKILNTQDRAQRNAQYVEALAFEREDFPLDKAMADFGILVNEISDS